MHYSRRRGGRVHSCNHAPRQLELQPGRSTRLKRCRKNCYYLLGVLKGSDVLTTYLLETA